MLKGQCRQAVAVGVAEPMEQAEPQNAGARLRTLRTSWNLYRACLRSAGVAALVVGVVGGCHSDSPTAAASNDHYMGGSIAILSAWMDGSPVLQEAEVLVDGERVGHQTFVPGSDRAFFNFEAIFRSAGRHKVAIRVIRQSRASVEYSITGGIGAAKLSAGANSVINYRFFHHHFARHLESGDHTGDGE